MRYLLKLRYTRDLIDQLKTSRLLRRVCGLKEIVPNESTFSRFYRRLAQHQDLVDAAIVGVVDRVSEELDRLRVEGVIPENAPKPGEMVAIDSSDIEAYGNRRTGMDVDATVGIRTAKLAANDKE